jgi:uncharacterized RDD family membrane protein YckC
MDVFIAKDGQKMGPYAEELLPSMLADGLISSQDSFWKLGMATWQPLSDLIPPTSPPQIASVRYAGFWLRFAALLIDIIVFTIGTFIVGFAIGLILAIASINTEGLDAFFDLVGITVGWLYFALMESSSLQATLGKLACGIKVTDLQGRRISFGRATGRNFGKIISYIILCIGFFMAGWTAKKQALHDLIASCLVIRK